MQRSQMMDLCHSEWSVCHVWKHGCCTEVPNIERSTLAGCWTIKFVQCHVNTLFLLFHLAIVMTTDIKMGRVNL